MLYCPLFVFVFDDSAIKSKTGTTSTSQLSCRIFASSALAPNFSLEHKLDKADMASLVHSRACYKAEAVSVPSKPSSVLTVENVVPSAWICGFL